MENNKIKNSSSNIKCIRGLRNIIKSSMNKGQEMDNHLIELNSNKIMSDMIYNDNSHYKNGANFSLPINNNINNIKSIKNNIEEIIIKTNYQNDIINNTSPTANTIYKQNKKLNSTLTRFNIKKLNLPNKRDISSDYFSYSNEDNLNNTLEKYKRKNFSESFRNNSKYDINDRKNKTLSIDNKNKYNNTPKINKYSKKILLNSESKSKIMKINTNNINNSNDNTIKSQRGSINKNIYLYPKKNNNYINNNEKINNNTNVTFDTSLQNDLFNITDENNQKFDFKLNSKSIENDIKVRIKENKEIKNNILLMIDEINKIKERQEAIIKYENDNQNKNNERNIKISKIIKKTYQFLNDFNMIVNEQNLQIYQEIINNLNIFFND